MILQEKKILCDTEEPDKNHLWLRPRINKDGYDLLYFGVNGWTPLIKMEDLLPTGCKPSHPKPCPDSCKESSTNL